MWGDLPQAVLKQYGELEFIKINMTASPGGHKHSFNLQLLIWFSPTFRHDPKAKHRFNFLLCTNKDFCTLFSASIVLWVDVTISWQSSFDKIFTSFFWSTPRRLGRDENWLHEGRPLVSHTTFKISNVLQASIPQQCVCSCRTTSCSPSMC